MIGKRACRRFHSAVPGLALMLLLGSAAGSLAAQTLFVDQGHPAADDKNPGTEAKPLLTIQPAVDRAQAGDTIWVKAGFYQQSVKIVTQGRRAQPITLAAWKDDRVRMGSEPKDLPGKEAWAKIDGTKSWQIQMPEGTPKDLIVMFDGKAQPCQITNTPPRDDQVLWSTYDPATRLLKLNAGGPNPAERNKLTLARDISGLVEFHLDSANWIIRGFEFGYGRNFVVNFGYNNIIEDCHFHHAYRSAIFGTGYLCTVRRCTFDDAALHGGPGASSLFEDNLFFRGGRSWEEDIAHRVMDYHEGSGGIMFKGIGYAITFRYNFCDDVAFWPDGNGAGTRLYGNAFHNHSGYAIYNEYADDDTLIIGNYMANCQAGVASSFCSRMSVLDNYIEGPAYGVILHNRDKFQMRHSFMTVRGNAIVGSPLPLSGYGANYDKFPEGWSNCLVDFNRYRVKTEGGMVLDLNGKLRCRTLEEMRQALGWDLHGEARAYDPKNNDLTPESMGGGTVTVRTPVGPNGWKARAFLADPAINCRWPAVPRFLGGTTPSFFWRIADGNYDDKILHWHGPEFRFDEKWWPGCGSGYGEGEVRGCAWYIATDPVAGAPDLNWGNLLEATTNNTFLVMAGKTPGKMLPQGTGYWTPSLPTAPGAVMDVSFRIRGVDLEPAGETGGPAVWLQFTSLTGQQKTRVFLVGRDDAGKVVRPEMLKGSFDWITVTQAVTAPPEAGRMALFLGLRPARGRVNFDDINLKTRPGEPPAEAAKKEALPPRLPLQRFREVFSVDLAPFVNRSFTDDEANNGIGGWSDQGPNCDMRAVETGRRKFGGVPFDILPGKSVVVLKSTWRTPGSLPDNVTIPVGRKVDTLFFLHSAAWFGGFEYILHYADGKDVTVTMSSKNMKDWAGEPTDYFPAEEVTYTTVAETVPSPQFGQGSLYRTEWSAPADRRAVDLKSIEFTNSSKCVAMLVAITGILEW
jgi:hypothetical protein